ncbi:hypothetical protein BT96DRAFT_1004360 [Gymnopus androsaceus JB14]|uniref:DUF6534 domain-containing protein n=1 Tax=Gymnopus androsaceus JB14 TaxID=1447944 RepID=A0A6A4GST3_9AGAR|nr:hypothetical protein BT96DRAFT_1004360 [Gymnopus androsaceus JB14]
MSTTDSLSPQQTLTALFFGFVVGTVLFGITLLESYRYFKSYKKDTVQQKSLVALLVGLDTLHFSFSIHVSYHYLVESFGDMDAISRAIWSVKALGTVQVVLLWLVQFLYLTRIWSLTRSMLMLRKLVVPVLFAVIVIAIIGFGAGLGMHRTFSDAVAQKLTAIHPSFYNRTARIESNISLILLEPRQWVVYLGFGVSAAIDVAIATIMIVILHRSITGMKRTDGVISALIHYFFSTGLLTSVAAIIYIILFAASAQTALYLGMAFLISRLYTISFLELLNVRNQLREDLEATVEIGFSSLRFKMPSSTVNGSSNGSSSLSSSEPLQNTGLRSEETV